MIPNRCKYFLCTTTTYIQKIHFTEKSILQKKIYRSFYKILNWLSKKKSNMYWNMYWIKNMYIGEQKTTDTLIALNPCHVDQHARTASWNFIFACAKFFILPVLESRHDLIFAQNLTTRRLISSREIRHVYEKHILQRG